MTSDMRRRTPWCLALVAVLFTAGCGGGEGGEQPQAEPVESPSAAAQSQLPDPCTLLTDEEINTQLDTLNNTYRTSRRQLTPFPDIGGGQCDIEASTNDGFILSFSLSVSPLATGAVFIENGNRTPIAGIGDEAFEVRDNYYAFARGVIVHIVNAPGSSRADSSIALLRAAVGRV